MSEEQGLVNLADAIEGLRAELMRAVYLGADSPMRFQPEPVELTVQAVVTSTKDGGLTWKLLTARLAKETAATHTVRLVLKPVWRSGNGELNDRISIASNLGPGRRPEVP